MSGVSVGDEGPPFEVGPLTRTDFVRYAGASNDFNPLHHDDEYARASGHPSVFAHGMLSAGLLASYVTGWFGAGSVRRVRVRFRERVWPGDVLRAEGRVTEVFEDHGESRAKLEVFLARGDGRQVVIAEAIVGPNARSLSRRA